MTSTLRLQIRDGIVRRLNAGRPIDIPEATTRRWIVDDGPAVPAVSVWIDLESRNVDNRSSRYGGPESRALRVNVQVINTTTDAHAAEDCVDDIVRWADDALGNTTLDDLAVAVVVERVTWEVIQSDRIYCTATLACLIQYQTTRGDSSRSQ